MRTQTVTAVTISKTIIHKRFSSYCWLNIFLGVKTRCVGSLSRNGCYSKLNRGLFICVGFQCLRLLLNSDDVQFNKSKCEISTTKNEVIQQHCHTIILFFLANRKLKDFLNYQTISESIFNFGFHCFIFLHRSFFCMFETPK